MAALSDERHSIGSDLRASLRVASALKTIAVAAVACGAALLTVSAKVDGLSTDAETRAAVTKCDEDDNPKSAPCRLDQLKRERDRQAFSDEQEARSRRTVERAMMRRLVSYDAADRQLDRKRKADSARIARDAFAIQCAAYHTTGSCGGMTLDQAAEWALDAK